MAKILRIMLLGIVLGVFPFSVVWGQISERVYRTEYHPGTIRQGLFLAGTLGSA